MPRQPHRIEYIDLLKGVCMYFVISFHCHVTYCPWFYTLIRSMYLPAFFFCAALFFKPGERPLYFTVRKVNLLIVPWAFFLLICFLGYATIYTVNMFVPVDGGLDWPSVLGPYNLYSFIMKPANLPSWFLWCIFLCYMVYYGISRLCDGRCFVWKLMFVVALAAAGLYLDRYKIRNSLMEISGIFEFIYDTHFYTALEMLPYMYVGELMRQHGLLKFNFRSLYGVLICLVAGVVWYYSSQKVFVTLYGHVYSLQAYLPGFAGTICVMSLCALIKHFPIISFLGRWSLTALCTHYMVVEIMENYVHNYWYLLAAVLPLSLLVMWVFVKYCPSFTGQRNLIPLPAPEE